MILRSTRAQKGRRLFLVAGLAASTVLVGCERETASSRALDQARMELLAISSGEVLVDYEFREPVYQSVRADLNRVAGQGTSSQNAAASLLIAQVESGLAERPMGRTIELEAEALHAKNTLRTKLSQWRMLNAQAEAAAAYDPNPELSAIQDQTRQRQQEINQAEAEKAEIEARVADLRRQASTKAQQARSLHQEGGRLRQQLAEQTAVEGEQTLTQAREIARRADALEVESAELEARAEQIEPSIREIDLRIAGIREQLSRLSRGTEEVQERARRAREEASQARASAATLAQEIDAAVGQLQELRTGDLASAYEEALRGFESSATAARGAMAENRTASNLASATAQHAIGDLAWSRAHGLDYHREALTALAEAEPALPQAQRYRQIAQEAASAKKESLAKASEAYSAARDGYSTAGAVDRMTRVTDALDEIVNLTGGGVRDLGAATGIEGTEWTGTVEAGQTPQETLQNLMAGIETADPGIVDLFYFEYPEQREQVAAIVASATRFLGALSAQFGAASDGMVEMLSSQGPGLADLGAMDPASAPVTVDGDVAAMVLGTGELGELRFRQVDGRWLVDLTDALESPDFQMMATVIPQMIDDVTAQVEAGQFNSPEEAVMALAMRVMTDMGG